MIEIFALYMITATNIVEVDHFPTMQACVTEMARHENSFCKSQYTDGHDDQRGKVEND